MKLSDTVKMMNSADYKERFKAEYWQTKIRYEQLHRMTVKYEAGTLDLEPDCELSLLLEQKKYMGLYLNRLEVRAEVEGIGLEALKDGSMEDNDTQGADIISDVILQLDDMPTLTQPNEWVSVEKRLPEDEARQYIKDELDGLGYLYPCLLTYKSPNTELIHGVRLYYDLIQT